MPKNFFFIICLYLVSHSLFSQNEIRFKVLDKGTNLPLSGATLYCNQLKSGKITDSLGIALFKDAKSICTFFSIRNIGYQEIEFVIDSTSHDKINYVYLSQANEELEEIFVNSTRSSRTIDDIPTRIEFVGLEEIEEKSNMKVGDIRMLLGESTGIQIQQTSATSGNASIRIQGLDGRYTLMLKDGFPIYNGAASGLGLLQTPPLDLKQVEIIKGSSSTLYGGGAIAGMVNLISKTPKEQRELTSQINFTSAKGYDINSYYSKKFSKIGITVLGSFNKTNAYDPAGIDFTAIPKAEKFMVNPKLFYYINDSTKIIFGVNTTFENRLGGDVHYVNGIFDANNKFFESNISTRISSQFTFEKRLNRNRLLTFRNSLSYFRRGIQVNNYKFDGTQLGSFSELSMLISRKNTEWITGLNYWTEDFEEIKFTPIPKRNYNQQIFGGFIQNTTSISSNLSLETGLRADYVLDYGIQILPRASILVKFSEHFTSRIGGGAGYKVPTIFTEESEKIQYNGVLPISPIKNVVEKSLGGNFDLNYTTIIADEVNLGFNQLFFYTKINRPLLLQSNSSGYYEYLINSIQHIDSRGIESNLKISYKDFKIFLGYTSTNTLLHFQDNYIEQPLTPKHKINSILMYEVPNKWKVGLEAYYFSQQKLSDGLTGSDYWIYGFMTERIFKKFSIYINLENFTDTRQSKFDTIFTGNISRPVFRDIYAPLDGFVTNGGVKFRF